MESEGAPGEHGLQRRPRAAQRLAGLRGTLLRARRLAAGKFSVHLYAWDDLQEWLHEGPERISRKKAIWVWRRRTLRLHSRLIPYFHERSAPLLEHVYVELQLDPERLRGAADSHIEALEVLL